MTNSSLVLYRPSILELARGGNFRAIAYWINSLLGPYGIYIRAGASKSGHLNILVDFQQPRRREFYVALRQQLVRFICYRLWTLNSERIRDVRIVARIAGEPDILWKQTVRIATPASRDGGHQGERWRRLARRGSHWLRFLVLRSAFVSRLAVASFFLCYWLIYWEIAGRHTPEQATGILSFNAIAAQEQPFEPSVKGQLRAGSPLITTANPTAANNSLVQLGTGIQQQTTAQTIADQFQGKIVAHVNPVNGEKVVALTFDDGPWDGTTGQVLDILKQYDVKATFFWVGQQIRNNPELAKQVVADGHAVGNHTWRHPMNDVDQLTAADEVGNTARLIYETTGVRTNLFRPPGGNLSGSMVPYAKQQHNIVTMWSVESEDYYVSAPIIVDNVLKGVQPGGIILLHDGGGDRSQTVQALPQIITTLQRQGYRFVTVPELLAMHTKGDVAGTFQEPGQAVQPPVSSGPVSSDGVAPVPAGAMGIPPNSSFDAPSSTSSVTPDTQLPQQEVLLPVVPANHDGNSSSPTGASGNGMVPDSIQPVPVEPAPLEQVPVNGISPIHTAPTIPEAAPTISPETRLPVPEDHQPAVNDDRLNTFQEAPVSQLSAGIWG